MIYILDDEHRLIPVAGYDAFFAWLDAKRVETGQDLPIASLQVARDEVAGHTLSTIFMGVDHNFGSGPPLVFETMYFNGDDQTWRWSSWDEAVTGHEYLKITLGPCPCGGDGSSPRHPESLLHREWLWRIQMDTPHRGDGTMDQVSAVELSRRDGDAEPGVTSGGVSSSEQSGYLSSPHSGRHSPS